MLQAYEKDLPALQILATCLFFDFAELCIYIRHFVRVPTLMFIVFVIYQKFKGGPL